MSIFWDINTANEIAEEPFPIITEGTQDMGNGVYLLKAGTPISAANEVANDGTAAKLVGEDYYFYSNTPTQPKLVKVITGGYVDINAAEEASGLTYTDAAKSALESAGITLVDGKLPAGGGGGGGAFVLSQTIGADDFNKDSVVEFDPLSKADVEALYGKDTAVFRLNVNDAELGEERAYYIPLKEKYRRDNADEYSVSCEFSIWPYSNIDARNNDTFAVYVEYYIDKTTGEEESTYRFSWQTSGS